jgi:hypothetical protein
MTGRLSPRDDSSPAVEFLEWAVEPRMRRQLLFGLRKNNDQHKVARQKIGRRCPVAIVELGQIKGVCDAVNIYDVAETQSVAYA